MDEPLQPAVLATLELLHGAAVRHRLTIELYRAERARLGALLAVALWSLWQKTLGLDHSESDIRRRGRAEFEFWCAAVVDGQRWL